MLKASSSDRLTLLDRSFLVSIILGTAASYSIIYLFHLLLAVKLTRSVLVGVAGQASSMARSAGWDIAFFCFFFGWYALSIVWADNKIDALQYCAYVGMAALVVFYTMRICDTILHLQVALRLLAITVSVEIFLSTLEGMGIIRLPFSSYSPYLTYFGRQPSDLSELNEQSLTYVQWLPTGFFGNPNNLASFLVLILPFFILHKTFWIKFMGAFAILFVVYMAGARAALIAYCAVVAFALFFYASRSVRVASIIIIIAIGSLAINFVELMQESPDPRIAEVGTIGVAIRDMADGLLESGDLNSGGSVSVRVHLIQNGLEALKASSGLGVGAGGNISVQENASSAEIGKVRSMHNFWVEILVEGGIGFAVVFAAWYLSLLWRMRKVGQHSPIPLLEYCGRSLFLGFLGFLFGAVGPSSVIYMLPMWMMVGIALATNHLDSRFKAAVPTGEQRSSQVSPALLPRPGSPDVLERLAYCSSRRVRNWPGNAPEGQKER